MDQQPGTSELASELRTVVTRLVKKLRTHSATGENLSLTERSTIGLLDQHKSLLPNELAAMEKITTQSMSQILNHLSALGYISRKISKEDKRKSIISLSKTGEHMLYKIRNEREEWLGKALENSCSVKELDVLRRAIIILTRLVNFD